MKLFNSLTKTVEELKPISAGHIKLYTCGPTVYDHVHIGNLRTYVFEDTLRRTLKAQGLGVEHVINITDVDDKTIRRSSEQYPDEEPRTALTKLTEHYEKQFLEDAKLINADLSQSKIARATEHIAEMQQLINEIPNKYIGDDGVYYDITKDPDYGVLVKLDHTHEHHRINNDEYDKDHVADFALWKKQSGDEPGWDFEIDGQDLKGRPGWHIECSAMSVKYLGQPFDIHTGGVDLKFPHHENEIAQSRAATAKPLANYFVHSEYLLVDGHKMSKKLKNFYILSDVLDKNFDPLALRLLFLQAHYRSQLNFTWDSLEAAAANLKAIQDWADLVHQTENSSSEENERVIAEIMTALEDDVNTPKAVAALNSYIGSNNQPTMDLLERLDELLALDLAIRHDITDEQKALIQQRETARSENDWAESDRLRDQLKEQGISLKDSDDQTVWSRI